MSDASDTPQVRRQRRMCVALLGSAHLTLEAAQRALSELHGLVATDEDGTEWAGVLADIVAEAIEELDDVRLDEHLSDPISSDDTGTPQ